MKPPILHLVRLSTRGHAAAFTYRVDVASLTEPRHEAACSDWAARNQISPVDGVILCALLRGESTCSELAGRLPRIPQSHEMISIALERLVARGFAEPAELSIPLDVRASLAAMRGELSVAQAALVAKIGRVSPMSNPADGTRMHRWDSVSRDPHTLALLEAVYRVDAARRALAALLEWPAPGARSKLQMGPIDAGITDAMLHRDALQEWADDGGEPS